MIMLKAIYSSQLQRDAFGYCVRQRVCVVLT